MLKMLKADICLLIRERIQEKEITILLDVYVFTLDIDDSDVNFQEAEIDGYMFASIDEIKAFAQEGIFLHYDSIKKVFE